MNIVPGIPFNVASYALLTHLVAHVCGLKVKEFVHFMADTHIYLNHRASLSEQIKREPKKLPTLWLNPVVRNIDDFRFDDIKLVGYDPHPALHMDMAV